MRLLRYSAAVCLPAFITSGCSGCKEAPPRPRTLTIVPPVGPIKPSGGQVEPIIGPIGPNPPIVNPNSRSRSNSGSKTHQSGNGSQHSGANSGSHGSTVDPNARTRSGRQHAIDAPVDPNAPRRSGLPNPNGDQTGTGLPRADDVADAERQRLAREAEEAERVRREAEEAERVRQEAEEAERVRREAEEAERARRTAEVNPATTGTGGSPGAGPTTGGSPRPRGARPAPHHPAGPLVDEDGWEIPIDLFEDEEEWEPIPEFEEDAPEEPVMGVEIAEGVYARGMRNLGATCYFNAMWQVLTHLPAFRTFIEGLPEPPMAGVFDRVVAAAKAGVAAHWSPEAEHIQDLSIYAALQGVEPQFFDRYTMQDAQEALLNLRLVLDNASVELGLPRSPIFDTTLEATKICRSDRSVTITSDVNQEISLSLPELGGPVELEQLIRGFMHREFIESLQCPDLSIGGFRQLRITGAPDVLVLHLKRFAQRGDVRVRINTRVTTPAEIDLSGLPGHPANSHYRLRGVVMQSGALNSGHYTAYYLHPTTNQWVFADDRRTILRELPAAPSQEPYLLFYERIVE